MNSFSKYISEKIRNIAGNYINPATEEKQDGIITAIGLVTTPSDTQPISATTLPLPTGASTSANQSTIISHVDGIETQLTTLNSKDFATETGIQQVKSAIENISIPAPIGGATEAKQDSLETLTQSIYELIERLSFLASVRDTTGSLRTAISNTPNIGTLTTVSTLSNMSSVGGYLANPQIPGMMNNTAIQSNISNITIS